MAGQCKCICFQIEFCIVVCRNCRSPYISKTKNSQRNRKIELTRKQKLEILDKLYNGTPQKRIADQYGVDRSCVSRVKSNKAKIRAAQENNENLEMKRKQKAGGEDVENALFAWFTELRANNAPVLGPMLLEKACQISISFVSDFTPTSHGLKDLKKIIHFSKMHGEKSSADFASANN